MDARGEGPRAGGGEAGAHQQVPQARFTERLASARAEHGALSTLPGGWQGRDIVFAADREL